MMLEQKLQEVKLNELESRNTLSLEILLVSFNAILLHSVCDSLKVNRFTRNLVPYCMTGLTT